MRGHSGGQTFISLTRPGVTRGNHYHRRKVERFLVVAGILGAIMLLALVALAVYALVILPQQQRAAQPTEALSEQQTATELAHALQVTNTATATNTRTAS